MEDYIMEFPGAATPEFCEMMIRKYEQDGRYRPSLVGPEARMDKLTRDSMNLEIPAHKEWAGVHQELKKMIWSRVKEYVDTVHISKLHSMFCNPYDADYTMMRYDSESVGYTFHNDFMFDTTSNRRGVRTITWLFYLNECDGGETEFQGFDYKIVPKPGKLVFFPSDWTMVHRGMPVRSGYKYLCVGWIYSTWNQTIKPRR